MSREHFTLTISQDTIDGGNYSIHLKDCKRNHKHFIMQLHFAKSVVVDGLFIDDVVSLIARCLAKKLIEQQELVADFDNENISADDEEELKQIVSRALEKIKKM